MIYTYKEIKTHRMKGRTN